MPYKTAFLSNSFSATKYRCCYFATINCTKKLLRLLNKMPFAQETVKQKQQ